MNESHLLKKLLFSGVVLLSFISSCGLQEAPEPAIVDTPKIFAHRGANDRYNESTLTAYKIAANDGVDALEMDLRMTKDGSLIVMHDNTIDRTTTGQGEPTDYSLEKIKSFETVEVFGQQRIEEEIPTLEEIIQEFGDTEHYYIETRLVNGKPKMEEPLIRLLNEYQLIEKGLITIQSFSEESLEVVHQLEEDIPLTLLYKKGKFRLNEAEDSPYPIIGMESTDVNVRNVNELHRSGKEVHVYFTDPSTQKEEQKRVKELNVDGYFTDDIQYTKELLSEEK